MSNNRKYELEIHIKFITWKIVQMWFFYQVIHTVHTAYPVVVISFRDILDEGIKHLIFKCLHMEYRDQAFKSSDL